MAGCRVPYPTVTPFATLEPTLSEAEGVGTTLIAQWASPRNVCASNERAQDEDPIAGRANKSLCARFRGSPFSKRVRKGHPHFVPLPRRTGLVIVATEKVATRRY
jgi:hypothetical protein